MTTEQENKHSILDELSSIQLEGWESSHPELARRIFRIEQARNLVEMTKEVLKIAEKILDSEECEYRAWMKEVQNA